MKTRDNKVAIEIDAKVDGLEDVERLTESLSELPPQVVIKGCRDCEITISPQQTNYIPFKYETKEKPAEPKPDYSYEVDMVRRLKEQG